jgi:protein-S-isoprenylcysteine O-methyltransferase Ste14
MANQSKKLRDMVDRSVKGSNLLPRFVFSALRAVDPYLQHLILFGGYGGLLISKAGLVPLPAGPKGTVIVVMAASCALKQIINMSWILQEKIPLYGAVLIGLYNTVCNGLASLSSLIYEPSRELGPPQYIGIGLFTVGLLTELVSEVQRKRFKDDPANKGKNYAGGLFSLARHINYGGYTLWRTGLALTSGNYWLAALQFTWLTYDFTYRAVPCLTQHCSAKYGDGWKKFEHDVPNILFPFLW